MNAEEIREEIRKAYAEISRLGNKKGQTEAERAKGENLLAEVDSWVKSLTGGIEYYRSEVINISRALPGNYGRVFSETILRAIEKSGANDIELEMSKVKYSLKERVLFLDNVIDECVRKINEQNSLLQTLKNALQAAEQIIQETMPGGQ